MRAERDWLQFDCALSYGLVEYLRTLEMLKANAWSPRRCIPHGGHQMSLNIAAGLGLGGNESYPDVFQPFGGFAAETANVVEYAKQKLARKGCDWILANDVSPESGVMGGDSNTIHLIAADRIEHWPPQSKTEVAAMLVERIAMALDRK